MRAAAPHAAARLLQAGAGRLIRMGLCAGAGALAALGHAPWGMWSISLLMFVLAGVAAARWPGWITFSHCWAAGSGYFLVTLFWVVEPFLVDAERHAWLAPFALAGLSGGLALFWGAAGLMARWWGGALALPIWLALAELTRGHVATGFPWALPGYVWVDTPVRLMAAGIGSYGLTALTLAATIWAGVGLGGRAAAAINCVPPLVPVIGASLAAVGLMLPVLMPLADPPPMASEQPVVVRLVQPNVPQALRWQTELLDRWFQRHLRLSAALPTQGRRAPDLIVWSENALPVLLDDAQPALTAMAAAAPEARFVSGIMRSDGRGRYRNSLVSVGKGGRVDAVYDKHHLVPFGEYIPLTGVIERLGLQGLSALASVRGGYTPGPGPELVEIEGIGPVLPLVCYEAIFPRHTRLPGPRPQLMLQITNDAWFGSSAGPWQHLAQARMRAVELGIPLARAANTGISAMIDARGEIVVSLPLGAQGFVDADVPPALPQRTLYGQTGDAPLVLILLGLLLAVGLVVGSTKNVFDRSTPEV